VDREASGALEAPARLWIGTGAAVPKGARAAVPLAGIEPSELREGDVLCIETIEGDVRELDIVECEAGGAWAEAVRDAHVTSGAPIEHRRNGRTLGRGSVGDVPPVEGVVHVSEGDRIVVGPESDGREVEAAGKPLRIGCDLPEILDDVRVGERVAFDDGKLEGVVRSREAGAVEVEITAVHSRSGRLKAGKSINFPESHLRIAALTDADRRALAFAKERADMVGMSFVRRPEDVEQLVEELLGLPGRRLGIVLKIETHEAFEALPRLLLSAMQSPPVGIMVARGDLGVEIGFERMAEVQEEILWLCEAAHVPVVWATQVLENLAKRGLPARGEVTDAAMSVRAECVMLNKGAHIVETVDFLRGVLRRMQDHQSKKLSLLRRLRVSERI